MIKLAKTCFIAAVAAGAILPAMAESTADANGDNSTDMGVKEQAFKNYRFCGSFAA